MAHGPAQPGIDRSVQISGAIRGNDDRSRKHGEVEISGVGGRRNHLAQIDPGLATVIRTQDAVIKVRKRSAAPVGQHHVRRNLEQAISSGRAGARCPGRSPLLERKMIPSTMATATEDESAVTATASPANTDANEVPPSVVRKMPLAEAPSPVCASTKENALMPSGEGPS